jgi:hypothetical protein
MAALFVTHSVAEAVFLSQRVLVNFYSFFILLEDLIGQSQELPDVLEQLVRQLLALGIT